MTAAEFTEMLTEDIHRCGEIYFEAFEIPSDRRPLYRLDEYFLRFIEEDDKYAFVMKENGRAVGFILACEFPDQFGQHSLYISDVAVDPERQKSGIGTKMTEAFTERLSDSKMMLLALQDRPAHRMYEKAGFKDQPYVHMTRLCGADIMSELENMSFSDGRKMNADEYSRLTQLLED